MMPMHYTLFRHTGSKRVQLFADVEVFNISVSIFSQKFYTLLRHRRCILEIQRRKQMDRIFANCVDQIALAGPEGLLFGDAVHTVLGSEPDSSIVSWIIYELRKRSPILFTSPDFNAPLHQLHVTACEALRNNALSYNILENGTLQPAARRMLEVVGKHGPNGILQSDLAGILSISPVMVHHYLVSLLSRELVAKKKVVLTRKKQQKTPSKKSKSKSTSAPSTPSASAPPAPPPTPTSTATSKSTKSNSNQKPKATKSKPGNKKPLKSHEENDSDDEIENSNTNDNDKNGNNDNANDATDELKAVPDYTTVTVTYTAVIVLSRFEAFIANTNLTKTFQSIQHGVPVPAPGAPAAFASQFAHLGRPDDIGSASNNLDQQQQSSSQPLVQPANHPLTAPVITTRISDNDHDDDNSSDDDKVNEEACVSIIDIAGDERMHRIINALMKTSVRAERDLKVLCMPDEERHQDLSIELFRRKRHRSYRTLRSRLVRLGLAKVVRRDCKSVDDKPLGKQPCLVLTKLGRTDNALEMAFRKRNQSGGYTHVHKDSEPKREVHAEANPNDDENDNNENNINGAGDGATSANPNDIIPHVPNLSLAISSDPVKIRASSQLPRELVSLFQNFNGAALTVEIDVVQQVYEIMIRAGAKGISVPELDAYLDCGSGLTGMPQKRIRNIVKAIARKEPMLECQLFEGKIMYVRFALAKFVEKDNPYFRKSFPEFDNPPPSRSKKKRANNKNKNNSTNNNNTNVDDDDDVEPPRIHKRRKLGITTLGEKRQEIILRLLDEKKVFVLESLGREVATAENSGLIRIDQKVMRRIINDLVEKKKMKIISASKPSIKENKRWQTIRLAALPDVPENSIEVRRVVSAVVDRALYGSTEEGAESAVKKEDEIVANENDSDWEPSGKKRTRSSSRKSNQVSIVTPESLRPPSHALRGRTRNEAIPCDEEDNAPVIVENLIDRPRKAQPSSSSDPLFPTSKPSPSSANIERSNKSADKRKSTRTTRSSTSGKEVASEVSKSRNEDPVLEDEVIPASAPENPSKRRRASVNSADMEEIRDSTTHDKDEIQPVVRKLDIDEDTPSSPQRIESSDNVPLEKSRNGESGQSTQGQQSSLIREKTCTPSSSRPPFPRPFRKQPHGSLKEALAAIDVDDENDEVIEVPVDQSSDKDKDKDKDKDNSICIQTTTRDTRKSRIARLRAIDYGWMKGSMARARLFHKLLFKVASEMEEQKAIESDGEHTATLDFKNIEEVTHVSIEEGRTSPTIGELKIYSCFNEMTVGEYAATVGLCFEHGDLIESIKDDRVEDVTDIIKPEITSQHACRRIKSLVQLLTKLGLIQPRNKSHWSLCGSGIIRDFGRGMPPGVVPHAVPFRNRRAVETFWKEMRQFASFKMPRGRNLVQWRSERPHRKREWTIRDIYHPVAWETGMYHDFGLYDQLLYECVLQRLCGVDISGERLNLLNAPVHMNHLRHFSVEELVDELDRVGRVNSYVGRRQRYAAVSEGLLRYARMRAQSPMPAKLLQQSEGFGSNAEGFSPNNIPIFQKATILRVKRKGTDIDSEEVMRTVETEPEVPESRRPGKVQAKKKLRVDAAPIVAVLAHSLVEDLRAIIHSGSVSYCCEEIDFLDWRKVSAAVHARRNQSRMAATISAVICGASKDKPEAVISKETEAMFRAVTGLCHCVFLRSAFDVLALRVVLQIRERAVSERVDETGILPRHRVETLAADIMSESKELTDVILGVVKEVAAEVEREWRVIIQGFEPDKIVNGVIVNHRTRIMKTFTELDRRRCGPDRSLSQTIHVMSARFRRVASLRLRRNVLLGLLLEDDRQRDREEFESMIRGKVKGRRSSGGLKKYTLSTGTALTVWETLQQTEAEEDENKPLAQWSIKRSVNGTIDDDDKPIEKHIASGMRLKRKPSEASSDANSSEPRSETEIASDLKNGYSDGMQTRVELAEVLVSVVLRQNRFEQWSRESKALLSNLSEDVICLARDRQILRGSVVLVEDYDRRRRHLSVRSMEKPNDSILYLNEENVLKREQTWESDFKTRMNATGNGLPFDLNGTEFYKDIHKMLPSISCSAVNACARMTLLTDLDKPELEMFTEFIAEDGYDDKKCVVKVKWHENRKQQDEQHHSANDKTCTKTSKHTSERRKDISFPEYDVNIKLMEWMKKHINISEYKGVTLVELIDEMQSTGWWEATPRKQVIGSLRTLVKEGQIRRFTIMTTAKKWTLRDGAVFVSENFCRGMKGSEGWIGMWSHVDGRVDIDFVRETATSMMDTIIHRPGTDLIDIVNSSGDRLPWVPRRSLVDILIALVSVGLLELDIIQKNSQTRMWESFAEADVLKRLVNDSDTDGLSLLAWERQDQLKICVKSSAQNIRHGHKWMGSNDAVTAMVRAI